MSLKKIALVFAASAFSLTLAAPIASACGGMDKAKQETAEKDTNSEKAEKTDKKVAKKADKKAVKKAPKKVASKTAK